MSLARAIAEAKGLDPLKDFIVQDDGAGPYIKKWDTAVLGPVPTQAEITQYLAAFAAGQTQRDKEAFIHSIRHDYVRAMILNDLYQDSTALDALIGKVNAEKNK